MPKKKRLDDVPVRPSDAMRLAASIEWKPGEGQEEFIARHQAAVRKQKRMYTAIDKLAGDLVLRAMGGARGASAAVKELIDRIEGPVRVEIAQVSQVHHVVQVPMVPAELAVLPPAQQWQGMLALQGVVVEGETSPPSLHSSSSSSSSSFSSSSSSSSSSPPPLKDGDG